MKSPQLNNDIFEELAELLRARSAMATNEEMPETGELAAFFYGKSNKPEVARQIALNRETAEEVALYAKAEHAAGQTPHKSGKGVPAEAWEMIRRWVENEFARPKPEARRVSGEALEKLARIIAERETAREPTTASSRQVTVLVLNTEGEICGFEKFEKSETRRGDITLKHVAKSERFNNRELHALSHQGNMQYAIESYKIERDKVRIGKLTSQNENQQRTDYFIIED